VLTAYTVAPDGSVATAVGSGSAVAVGRDVGSGIAVAVGRDVGADIAVAVGRDVGAGVVLEQASTRVPMSTAEKLRVSR
jgi:hypothetical protein